MIFLSQQQQQRALRSAQKICIVRTDKIGDMVLTLPLCKAIHDLLPQAHTTIIASSYNALIAQRSALLSSTCVVTETKTLYSILQQEQFDAIIFPRARVEEYYAAWKASVPLRIGSGYRAYSPLLNAPVWDHRQDARYHESEYNTRLVATILHTEYTPQAVPLQSTEQEQVSVQQKLEQLQCANKPIIIIHPRGGGSAPQVSPETMAIAVRDFLQSSTKEYTVLATGIESDALWCQRVCNQLPTALNCSGMFTLGEMIALTQRATLLLANSTGVLHIAAVVGCAVVGFYPNSPAISPSRWAPLTSKKIILTPPQSNNIQEQDNMSRITTASITDAIHTLLSC